MTRLGPRTLFCVALSLATVAPLAAAAPSASQAVPRAPLHTYLTNADYPSEAIRNGEQGTVEFRLTVDLNGRVSDCAIQASSGSAVLDATSCRIMTERARFNPARDENGKPVSGPFESRVSWRLPEDTADPVDLPPAVGAAMQIWSACTHGEAAKLVLSVVPAPEVATRSLAACARFEALALREMTKVKVEGFDPTLSLPFFRDQFAKDTAQVVERWRTTLKARGRE